MIGTGELIVMLCVVLILFGGKKLPELARSIGLGIREFKKACNGLDDEIIEKPPTSASKNQAEPVTLIVEPESKDQ
ncbi:MAG TPA: twin-arginine translocase TatA/TatE family subunit [Parachlamydiaceae bacterium]|nr:twin-arginine translocase TatA/TatE family subunit [Parachlamydiaceae bacterium]